jgi:hypothetical protein
MPDPQVPRKGALKKKTKKPAVLTDEEEAYQKKIKWLQDHGEPIQDELPVPPEEESSDSSSESE